MQLGIFPISPLLEGSKSAAQQVRQYSLAGGKTCMMKVHRHDRARQGSTWQHWQLTELYEQGDSAILPQAENLTAGEGS